MKFQINHRFSRRLLFEAKTESIKHCVVAAVASSADLAGADLVNEYLGGAGLRSANLAGANLAGA